MVRRASDSRPKQLPTQQPAEDSPNDDRTGHRKNPLPEPVDSNHWPKDQGKSHTGRDPDHCADADPPVVPAALR